MKILIWLFTILVMPIMSNLAWADNTATYKLQIDKKAYDFDNSGVIITPAKTGISAAELAVHKPVKYVVGYKAKDASGNDVDPLSLGALNFEDTISSHMSVTQVDKPTVWGGAANALSFSTDGLLPGSQNGGSAPAPNTVVGGGNGDGMLPFIYFSADGTKKKIFMIYHHQPSGSSHINCVIYTTGAVCPGYPADGTGKATFGTAASGGYGTPLMNRAEMVGNKLYHTGGSATELFISCWNMDTDVNCGAVKVADQTYGPAGWNLGGVVKLPAFPNIVWNAFNGRLYCVDTTTNATCPANNTLLYANAQNKTTDVLAVGLNSIFVMSNGYLACMKVTGTPLAMVLSKCNPAYPIALGNSGNNQFVALTHYLNASGAEIGVCAGIGVNNHFGCYNFSGNNVTTPPLVLSNLKYNLSASIIIPGTAKVIYANFYSSAGNTGAGVCWDWATNAGCTNFKDQGGTDGLRVWSNTGQNGQKVNNGNAVYDYGYAYSPDGCIVGYSDNNILWSFDPGQGKSPCSTGAKVTLIIDNPKAFCDGLDHGAKWDRLEFVKTPFEVIGLSYTVYDGAACPITSNATTCTPLTTGLSTIPAAESSPTTSPKTRSNWKVPFATGVSLNAHPTLRIELNYTYTNNKAPTSVLMCNGAPCYKIDTLFSPGSDQLLGQVCVNASIKSCPAKIVDNMAIMTGLVGGVTTVLGRGFVPLTLPVTDLVYSDSAPAVNGNTLNSTLVRYDGKYQRADWSGDLVASTNYTVSTQVFDTVTWRAAPNMPTAANRNIYTASAYSTLPGVSFTYANLSAMTGYSTWGYDYNGLSAQDVVTYLRGDPALELKDGTNNMFRRRMLSYPGRTNAALGAIVHSDSLYDGASSQVFAMADDGMLHAFNANTGVENWAYVPRAILPTLPNLSKVDYPHVYLMDGQMTTAVAGSKTVLVSSTGGWGGPGSTSIFGIDITPGITPSNAMVLWETTGNALGRANGAIKIAKLANTTTVAVLGNGINSASGTAQLLMVNLATGVMSSINTGVTGGLSGPTIAKDAAANDKYAYAGDSAGNLWRFDLNALTAQKVFAPSSTMQPITAAPTVSAPMKMPNDTTKSGYMVYFGSGKFIDRSTPFKASAPDELATQAFRAVFDEVAATPTAAITDANLVLQAQTSSINQTIFGVDTPTRLMASSQSVSIPPKKGWYIALTGGERALNAAQLRKDSVLGDNIIFVSSIPTTSECDNAGEDAYVYTLAAATGAAPSTGILDVPGLLSSTIAIKVDNSTDATIVSNGIVFNCADESKGCGRVIPLKVGIPTLSTIQQRTWRQLFMR
jgi:Neisseria PilC beta-propeller domain